MCCARLDEIHDAKLCKNRHLRTIAQLCRAILSSQLRHVSTVGKFVKQQYVFHMSSQYGELRLSNGWDLLVSLGHPSKFQRVSRLAFVTAATSLTKLSRCLAVSWAGKLYIHFRGSCHLTEFCHVQNLLCAQVLCSPILAALLHDTRVVGVSQTFRRWAEGATYIRQVAITLGVGQYSSLC